MVRYISAELMANYDDTQQRLRRICPLEVSLTDGHIHLTFELVGRDEDYITITVSPLELIEAVTAEMAQHLRDD